MISALTRGATPSHFLERLRTVLDSDYVISGDRIDACFITEPRGRWHRRPAALARPANTAELARVVELCRESGVPMVIRGGGTGLVGGASMTDDDRELLISMDRMRSIRRVDVEDAAMTVEAGVTLATANHAAATYGLDVPLQLASGGSASVGGILATNAGGSTTMRYGTARRMVLGLEAVLADGRVLNSLSCLRKNNTGYDISGLLVGSEGTLGIITAATIALVPQPSQRATAWCAVESPEQALKLLHSCRHSLGENLSAFELIPNRALELVLEYLPGARNPLEERHPWYVLMDIDTAIEGNWLMPAVTRLLETELEAGQIRNAVIASSASKTDELWRLRDSISPAQKAAGASIKHDISVPVAAIPRMIDDTLPELERAVPGIRPCVFGHLGDGNLHFNLNRPLGWDDTAFLAREPLLKRIVYARVLALGGSIAAEHGIGQLRREQLQQRADPIKLDLLGCIKRALDPQNLLNPGKLIPG